MGTQAPRSPERCKPPGLWRHQQARAEGVRSASLTDRQLSRHRGLRAGPVLLLRASLVPAAPRKAAGCQVGLPVPDLTLCFHIEQPWKAPEVTLHFRFRFCRLSFLSSL